jgi:hypothetical protein
VTIAAAIFVVIRLAKVNDIETNVKRFLTDYSGRCEAGREEASMTVCQQGG